ncbi:ABATE domain-containing protein [Microbacterium sp. A8/3-1]|uniref:ABATE domain-containing protein n=1 Tax=Microbacterium sp. A8/3-1 TaxID=3160749 RepID=A0AAU7W1G2_9MICO
MFTFVSGTAAADLTATLAYRHHDQPHELLSAPDDLARWASDAGLVETGLVPTPADLERAKELREAIYRLLSIRARGDDRLPRQAVDLVNQIAASPPLTVSWQDDKLWRTGNASQLLSSLARDALHVLETWPSDRIKVCVGDDCSRVFIDISRNASRRWCGMRECGDKSKAKAYRARRKMTVRPPTPSP